MYNSKKVYAVILAGGSGERFGDNIPKQFKKLAGKTVMEHTLAVFEEDEIVDEIFIVVHPFFRYLVEEMILKNSYKKVSKLLNGGNTRQESSKVGIYSVPDDNSYVLIHDAVRPFVTHKIIKDIVSGLEIYESVDTCISSPDTIVRRNEDEIIEVPERKNLLLGQTPQGFRTDVIKRAYELYEREPFQTTDDCSLVIKYKLGRVGIVEGDRFNIKITYPEDMYFADKIFQVRSMESDEHFEEIEDKIKGKVLVVFGASRGIGKEILRIATLSGANAYGFSRKTNVDVSRPDDVANALKKVSEKEGKIDYVVNTAAILNIAPLESKEYEDIVQEIMTNYFGTIVVARESIKYLKLSKGSLLFFTSSSYTRGRSLYSIYSSTKAAIVNLMQALAEEFETYSCRVNAINPERTNTEMRRENFGIEDEATLLSAEVVAKKSLAVLTSDFSGMVFDVNKNSMY
ncbi:MAG TPA: 2-C-methyl-D-erythritol 4-phosphate cytidylyltransferase [Fervidobacterium sp.]|jgi:2-C-methyl-D-erythritol 4-phosphate cytidylyltransferase|nr:2-C-methyl-D-erythritol 4-phosphate cytidylyltransferase [Fervidobacterium sp.]HPT59717.1 2-C-methyl-D-erythritol 4-phosphate cytidylyltransferase [Fervidobacterium sp.]HRD20969.1 2-C-methyl-D-erythritol 4-phosphate cytidylyltransferase [Fervidobacterium sp.]